MEQDLVKSILQQRDRIDALQGEVFALKSALAVLVGHVALLTRAPHAKRDEMLRTLGAMLPSALAKMEHDDAPAAATVAFERSIETLIYLSRNAVRFDPVPPTKVSTPPTREAG